MDYPIEIKLKNPATNEIKTYHLRQCGAFEDDSLVQQLRTPDGKPNDKEVWIARFNRDYQELDDKIVRSLPRWEREALLIQWIRFNEVSSEIFLENQINQKEQEKTISSITKLD